MLRITIFLPGLWDVGQPGTALEAYMLHKLQRQKKKKKKKRTFAKGCGRVEDV